MIKRKRRSSKDAMDFIELSRDATKLLRDAQCLQQRKGSMVADPVVSRNQSKAPTWDTLGWAVLTWALVSGLEVVLELG